MGRKQSNKFKLYLGLSGAGLLILIGTGCNMDQSFSTSASKLSLLNGPVNGPAPGDFGSEEDPISFSMSNCTLRYPFVSAHPATSVVFNESDVLVAFSPQGSATASAALRINVWYSDEHAMTLGVRQVVVKSATGTTTTNYPVSQLAASPSSLGNPQIGATAISGDQAGTDVSTCTGGAVDSCSRPMWPALFVTDITSNSTSLSGDWQSGGKAIAPSAIYGTWKAAVRTVDNTRTPAIVTVLPDANPTQNDWNLGANIPIPAGVPSEGYTTLVSWNVSSLGLMSGHTYRIQFMVHDGDQRKTGGDVGQNCVNIQVP